MVRLFNRTRHDACVLKPLLQYAARRMGVKGPLIVLVKPLRRYYTGARGTMHRGFPYAGYLKDGWRRSHDERMLGKRSGWYEIVIPQADVARDTAAGHAMAFTLALSVLHVAQHESSHVADHREGRMDELHRQDPRYGCGRRTTHDKRPVELSAANREWDRRPRAPRELHAEALLINDLADSFLGKQQ